MSKSLIRLGMTIAFESSLSVDHEPEALVLKSHELANGSGNQQAIRNEVSLKFGDDLLRGLLIDVLLTGGDLTGLPVNPSGVI